MTTNAEKKQLNYLSSLSKEKPSELLYLFNLNWLQIAYKDRELTIPKNYFNVRNEVSSFLDLRGEPKNMPAEYGDAK